VGRTGRQGQPGIVANLVDDSDERDGRLERLEWALDHAIDWQRLPTRVRGARPPPPAMATLILAAGKDRKLRPGDVLGALTAQGGLSGADVGQIVIGERHSYVAVARPLAGQALAQLERATVKGRRVRARRAGLRFRD
jgi:ATP-independent RNA helicase DbpA